MFFFAKLLHAKLKHASGEVGSREKRGRKPWFAIALDEIRIRRILRKKADCKQSNLGFSSEFEITLKLHAIRADLLNCEKAFILQQSARIHIIFIALLYSTFDVYSD